MPTRRTYLDIKVDGKTRLKNATPITEFGPTSIAGAFLDIISNESDLLYDKIEYMHTAIDPTRNSGRELDNLGYMMGITRTNSFVAIDESLTNFYFYIDKRRNLTPAQLINNLYNTNDPIRLELQSAGIIDNATAPTKIIIPKGTYIYNNDKSISYLTLNNTEITNDITNGYVGILSNRDGSFSNVQSNVLIKHDLNQNLLFKDIGKYLFCTNTFPIQTGGDGLTDQEYRYKISTFPQTRNANELSIREAVITIPGVRNIYFERGKYGYGTYALLIEGTSPLVSEGLLKIIEDRISVIDGNDAAFVMAPEYRGVEMSFEIMVDIGYDQSNIQNNVRSSIIEYINNISIGGTIVWNEVISLIMNVDGVKDFHSDYYKIGEYDPYNKLNKKQKVLRTINQRSYDTEKFYTDKGLIKMCSRQV